MSKNVYYVGFSLETSPLFKVQMTQQESSCSEQGLTGNGKLQLQIKTSEQPWFFCDSSSSFAADRVLFLQEAEPVFTTLIFHIELHLPQ